jgi:hypothetical protein
MGMDWLSSQRLPQASRHSTAWSVHQYNCRESLSLALTKVPSLPPPSPTFADDTRILKCLTLTIHDDLHQDHPTLHD